MNFQTKRIRKKIDHTKTDDSIQTNTKKDSTKSNSSIKHFFATRKFTISAGIGLSLIIVASLVFGTYKLIKNFDFTVLLKIAGEELLVDSHQKTNFLLMGTGGKNHEGSDLTDTLMILSLDQSKKTISIQSLPRDLYIQDEKLGSFKINEILHHAKKAFPSQTEALEYTKNEIGEFIGAEIQYYAVVDFDGFKQIVDILGGVDVNVKEAIYDPSYPKDGTFLYEPFKISAGPQTLNGETALKYARSRKTTSDFDRSRRQQDLIFAIKEKALQTNILLSPEKIGEILNSLRANISTNIRINEIMTLGAIAGDYKRENIVQRLIHDNPVDCGGFLYTPMRELYGGAFVLIPAGGTKYIHLYTDLNFNYSEILLNSEKIHILNSTKRAGAAGETKQVLQRFCFDIVRFGNGTTKDITQTKYYYRQKFDENGAPISDQPKSLQFLQKIIPGQATTIVPAEYQEYLNQADLIIELGSDYTESSNYLEDPTPYI